MSRRSAALLLATLVGAAVAGASERSELLTAKGELAFHQGRYAEARALLREAVAADPADAGAQEALGKVLLQLGERDQAVAALEQAVTLDPKRVSARRALERARGIGEAYGGATTGEIGRLSSVRGAEQRRWSIHASTGVQYDSNVTLAPGGRDPLAPKSADQSDVAFIFSAGAQYDVVARDDLLVRLEYDLYQTLHPDIDEFDFRAQQPRATVSYALTPQLWVGAQGGYDYYTLGSDTYLGDPYAMPFLSLLEGRWGLSQLIYRWGHSTYFSRPFDEIRDGPTQTLSVSQSVYLPGGRYLTAGYQFNEENPSNEAARLTRNSFGQNVPGDWQLGSNQVFVGGGTPMPLGVYLDLLYLFRYDDYKQLNSFARQPFSNKGYAKTRQDDGHFLYVGLTRPITEHLSVAMTYYGAFNVSNIGTFDYRRNVIATLLQVTY